MDPLVAVFLLFLFANAVSQEVRLTKALVPELYDLSIKTYLDELDGDRRFTFDGQNTITLRCNTTTNQIIMHAAGMLIDTGNVQVRRQPSGSSLAVQATTEDKTRETLTITLSAPLSPGDRISVFINYTGTHRDVPLGLYRISYQQDSQTRIMLSTFMPPFFAHRVFPCFDDPAFRVNVSLRVQHRQERRAWSNMPVSGERDLGGGWRETNFSTTPAIPPQIFGLVVADYTCVSQAATSHNVKVSVCGPSPDIQNGLAQFALTESASHLQFFENFFDTPAPITKLDIVTVPGQPFDGFDNWGLLYYTNTALLIDPTANLRNTLRTSTFMARKISHLWMGHIVSFDWLNDGWSKEGAAYWLKYVASSASQPTWNALEFIYEREYNQGSVQDASPGVSKLNIANITTANFFPIFASLNLGKGAALFRMLYGVLGENTFRRGLGEFFRSHAFGVTTLRELWQALNDQSRRDGTLLASATLNEIMDTWIEQPGYPLLDVSRQSDGTLKFSQRRFLADPSGDPSTGAVAPYNFKWWLPVSWAASSNGQIRRQASVPWMGPSSSPTINVGPLPNWYLVNLDSYGFYRVLYDNSNWLAIAQQLRVDRSQIPTMTRVQLMTDSFALNRAKHMGAKPFLLLLSTMGLEQAYSVWSATDVGIFVWVDNLEDFPVYKYLQPFLACMLRAPLAGINMESEETQKTLPARLKRQIIVNRACTLSVPECVTPATKLWAKWKSRPSVNPVPTDLRFAVYCAAVREGTDEDWIFAYNKLTQPGVTPDESRNLRKALTCTRNVALLDAVLNLLRQNTVIAASDAIETLGFLLDPAASRRVAWSWLKSNLPWAQQQFLAAPDDFVTTIRETIARKMTFESDMNDIKVLGDIITDVGDARALYNQTVARVANNVRWRKDNEAEILIALIDYSTVYKCGSDALNSAKTTLLLALFFSTSHLLSWN